MRVQSLGVRLKALILVAACWIVSMRRMSRVQVFVEVGELLT